MSLGQGAQHGLWLDEERLGGPGTYAVVIGISNYRHLEGGAEPARSTYGLGQLYVSALTAFRFFQWLSADSRADSLVYCWLLLAPTGAELDAEPALRETAYAEPRLERVQLAIRHWHATMSDRRQPVSPAGRSVFFFSGHGFEVTRQRQLLLPSDYLRPDGRLNDAVSTENLVAGLAVAAPRRQLFFLDACRNDHERLRLVVPQGLPILDASPFTASEGGEPRAAPVFYGSATGSTALQPKDPRLGISFFGQALLAGLRGGAAGASSSGDAEITTYALQAFAEAWLQSAFIDYPGYCQLARLGGEPANIVVARAPAAAAGDPQGEPTPRLSIDDQLVTLPRSPQVSTVPDVIWSRMELFSLRLGRPVADEDGRPGLAGARTTSYRLGLPAEAGSCVLTLTDGARRVACLLPAAGATPISYQLTLPHGGSSVDQLTVSLDPGAHGELGLIARLQASLRASSADAVLGDPLLTDGDALIERSPLAALFLAALLLELNRPALLGPWLERLGGLAPELADGPIFWAERQRLLGAASSDALSTPLEAGLARGLPATAQALGYAARLAGQLQPGPVAGRLLSYLGSARQGGLLCVFGGRADEQQIGPALFMPPPAPPESLDALRGDLVKLLIRFEQFNSAGDVRRLFALSSWLWPLEPELTDTAESRTRRVETVIAFLRMYNDEEAGRFYLAELLRVLRDVGSPARRAPVEQMLRRIGA